MSLNEKPGTQGDQGICPKSPGQLPVELKLEARWSDSQFGALHTAPICWPSFTADLSFVNLQMNVIKSRTLRYEVYFVHLL